MPENLPEVRASHADRDAVVEILRVAGGEGRLTSEELDTRLGDALMAQTTAELQAIVADLPLPPAAKDGLTIEQTGGKFKRQGRWTVPHRIHLTTDSCWVTLDFTEALLVTDELHIAADVKFGRIRLITTDDMAVNADDVRLEYGKLKLKPRDDTTRPRLHIHISGNLTHSRIVEKRR